MIYWSILCNLFQVLHTFCYTKERYNLLFYLDVAYCLFAWNIIITIIMHPTATCTLTISFLNIILETLTIPLIVITILCLNGRGKAVLLSVNYWAIGKTRTPQAQCLILLHIFCLIQWFLFFNCYYI